MERDMKIKVGCVKESDTYFLFCSEGGPSSFHSSARVCIPHFPPCSGLQGLWSKPQGMLPDMLVSLVLHLTALMAAWTPYPHIAQLLHLSDDISCGICGIHVAVALWKNLLWVGWL